MKIAALVVKLFRQPVVHALGVEAREPREPLLDPSGAAVELGRLEIEPGMVRMKLETRRDDLETLLDDVADLNRALPVVIQPVTPVRGVAAPDRAGLEAAVELALERGLDVRVVPQIHPGLGLP